MKEHWKDLKAFPGYQVSDHGGVRSNKWNRLLDLKPQISKGGYLRVGLRLGGKTYKRRIHRLVLEAFLWGCPEGKECSHKDNNVTNNRLDNLRWENHRDNEARKIPGSRARKLNPDKVINIRELRSICGKTISYIADKHDIDPSTVRAILRRDIWKHVL